MPLMLRDLSLTTETMENVENNEAPDGAGVGDGLGEGAGEGDVLPLAVVFQNQLKAKKPDAGLCKRMAMRSKPANSGGTL